MEDTELLARFRALLTWKHGRVGLNSRSRALLLRWVRAMEVRLAFKGGRSILEVARQEKLPRAQVEDIIRKGLQTQKAL